MTDESGRLHAAPRVLILACGALAREIRDIARLHELDNVTLECLPASLHMTPDLIADAVRHRLQVVTVTVDLDEAGLREVLATVRPDRLQLHGDEPDPLVVALAPWAFRLEPPSFPASPPCAVRPTPFLFTSVHGFISYFFKRSCRVGRLVSSSLAA